MEYSTIQQHQPLRVPAGWGRQEKALIVQLDEIFDDIYRRFGRLKMSDMGKGLQKVFSDTEGNIAQINLSIDGLTTEVGNKISKTTTYQTAADIVTKAEQYTDGKLTAYSTTSQTATQISTYVSSALTAYSTTTQTASAISTYVTNALSNYSTTSQTATAISTYVTSALSSYSTTTQTASAISTYVTNALSSYSTTSQTATAISTYVTNALGSYSTTSQTSAAISAAVADCYGKVSGITIDTSGVDITGSKYVKIRSGGSFDVDATNFKISSTNKKVEIGSYLFNSDGFYHYDSSTSYIRMNSGGNWITWNDHKGSTSYPDMYWGVWYDHSTKKMELTGDKLIVNATEVYEVGSRVALAANVKPKQTAVSSPSASGSTTAFIDTISQDANGVITVTKKNVSFSGYKTTQTAVSDPTASGYSTWFIDSISQSSNGVISATKKFVNFSGYKTAQNEVYDPTASGTAFAFIDSFYQNGNGEVIVTKKSIGTMFQIKTYTKSITVNADTPLDIKASDFAVSTPSGYTVAGLAGFYAGAHGLNPTRINPEATGNTTMMTVFNFRNEQIIGTAQIKILYIRS